MPFTGKVALVTGSTRGIGAATAMLLAERGAHVLVTGRDARRGMRVVDTIQAAGGTAEFIAAALGNPDQCATLANHGIVVAGRVDILVNNAAIASFGPTAAVPEDEFDASFAVNVKTPYYLVGALAPQMAERTRCHRQRHHHGGNAGDRTVGGVRIRQGGAESPNPLLGGRIRSVWCPRQRSGAGADVH